MLHTAGPKHRCVAMLIVLGFVRTSQARPSHNRICPGVLGPAIRPFNHVRSPVPPRVRGVVQGAHKALAQSCEARPTLISTLRILMTDHGS